MKRRKVPIRWLLTAWYSMLLLAALAFFSGIIYFGLRTELNDNLDEQLQGQADLVRSAIVVEPGTLRLDWPGSSESNDEQFVRVWDAQADLARSTIVEPVETIGRDQIQTVLRGATETGVVRFNDSEFRVLSVPVLDGDQVVGVLQVGLSREDISDTLAALRMLFAITAPVMVIVAGASGYVLAGRALKPVRSITDLARATSSRDLGKRLNLDLADDEMGQLAATFDDMLDRIERAFERQQRFTGDAAHELRTPIGLMRSRVDVVLNQDRDTERYRHEFERIQVDLTRMTEITSSLLMLARADTDELPLDRQSFDLGAMIGHVGAMGEDRAEAAGIKLTIDTVPLVIDADEHLLIQVLLNLIDNAIRNTPEGGSITVMCRRDGTMVVVDTTDTGRGIPDDQRELVFDRFYRIETGRDRETGGVGLGLSLCRMIVQAHGGSIGVVPTSKPGTTIRITLPTS